MEYINEKRTKYHVNCSTKCKKKDLQKIQLASTSAA